MDNSFKLGVMNQNVMTSLTNTPFSVRHDLHRIPGNVFHWIRPHHRHEVVHGSDGSQHGKTKAVVLNLFLMVTNLDAILQ